MLAMHLPGARRGADPGAVPGLVRGGPLRWNGSAYDEEYNESFTAFAPRVYAAPRRTVERLEPKQTAVVPTSGGPGVLVAASLLAGGADL